MLTTARLDKVPVAHPLLHQHSDKEERHSYLPEIRDQGIGLFEIKGQATGPFPVKPCRIIEPRLVVGPLGEMLQQHIVCHIVDIFLTHGHRNIEIIQVKSLESRLVEPNLGPHLPTHKQTHTVEYDYRRSRNLIGVGYAIFNRAVPKPLHIIIACVLPHRPPPRAGRQLGRRARKAHHSCRRFLQQRHDALTSIKSSEKYILMSKTKVFAFRLPGTKVIHMGNAATGFPIIIYDKFARQPYRFEDIGPKCLCPGRIDGTNYDRNHDNNLLPTPVFLRNPTLIPRYPTKTHRPLWAI